MKINKCRCGRKPQESYRTINGANIIGHWAVSCEHCKKKVYALKEETAITDWNRMNPTK